MRFRSFDSLRLFEVVARHLNFTSAAKELNLTKGAVSYQINRLENELGFELFLRQHQKVVLTAKGRELWQVSHAAFQDLEASISRLRERDGETINIGMSTYFASRWLSPRLMRFISGQPRTSLRLQPLIDLVNVESENVDMIIRWGNGKWSDMTIELLFKCPAFPTAGVALAHRVNALGLANALPDLTLLQDREGSEAWRDWHRSAGLPYRPARNTLVIPDPNVRVQAVIDGQGVALNDALVSTELQTGQLVRISEIELDAYGYFLAYPDNAFENPGLEAFHDWIIQEAEG